jgi:hypothetical protein
MISQIDDHIALERRWTHRLAHQAGDAGFVTVDDKLHSVQELLDEARALLADAKLNAALQDSGVPPEKYATASVVERRKLLQDAISVSTMNKVLHMSSGCIPVKTFEARGDDGRYYIGVVVRYDRTSKTLAACFRQKVRPAISKPAGLTV